MAERRRATPKPAAKRPRKGRRLGPLAAQAAAKRPGKSRRLGRPARTALATLLVVALAGGGFLMARDSSLFAVRHLTVSGAGGPDGARMAAALRAVAAGMTTLHVDENALRRSLRTFPQVRGLRVRGDGRNGLRVRVIQYVPVGAVSVAGRRIPVAGDGRLLRGVPAAGALPTVPVRGGVAARRLADPAGLDAVAVLEAAPPALRVRVAQVAGSAKGLVASLRNGPQIYFGGADRLGAKWSAAGAVIADPAARGARYVDVRVPERPALGGAPEPVGVPAAGASGTDSPGISGDSQSPTSSPGTGESAANGQDSSSSQG